ncbi:MAG: pyruvate kinase [bacterium]|nr:pyruvate kinase [bacterium]
MGRRAKIGGTLGPACDDDHTLDALLDAGLDIARLNFSHGTAADHRRRVRRLRRRAAALGVNVTLLADLQGPRFRVGVLPPGGLELRDGERVSVKAGSKRSMRGEIPVSYPALARDVRRGDKILLDDGKLCLKVERVSGDTLRCLILRGGTLTDNKGINLPGSALTVPTLTTKDRKDLKVAVELGADWLAISFVRSAEDIRSARKLLQRAGSDMPIMAKIERREAIDNLPEIIEEADALLVARGDLGVELPAERVPILQKEIIEAANAAGKPVMTATQMLDSMRTARRPTRAEASDVANAVLDGSGCLLLTAETAAGSYPVEAVATMASIIREAEASGRARIDDSPDGELSRALTTCRAGCRAAIDVGAPAIVVFTQSGSSARQAARFRPPTRILAFAPSARIARRIGLYWGVEARTIPRLRTIEALMAALDDAMLDDALVQAGEVVVVLSGAPIGVSGTTNMMRLHRVGTDARGKARRRSRAAR